MKKAPKSSTQLRFGDRQNWSLPPMIAGSYAIVVAAAPLQADGDVGGGIRVNAHFGITTKDGDVTLPNEPGYEAADFGAGNLPSSFLSKNCTVQLDSEPNSVFLSIDGIYNHNDFINGNAGWISDIRLSKISFIQLSRLSRSKPKAGKSSKTKK